MPTDLESHLLRKGIGAMAYDAIRCHECRRTALPGEVLGVYPAERTLCALCARSLPDAEREPLRRERVRAGARQLSVVPRAA